MHEARSQCRAQLAATGQAFASCRVVLVLLLAAAALDTTGTLRRAGFNTTAALHYAGENGAAVSAYLLGLGGRRIVMVSSHGSARCGCL